jgi:signal transduction histidine kinase
VVAGGAVVAGGSVVVVVLGRVVVGGLVAVGLVVHAGPVPPSTAASNVSARRRPGTRRRGPAHRHATKGGRSPPEHGVDVRPGVVVRVDGPAQPAPVGQVPTGQAEVGYSRTLGQRLLYVAVPLASAGRVHGAVRITYPASFVEQRIRRTWLLLGGIGVVVLATVFLISLWLARSVSRPLRELEQAAARVGRGRLAARAPVPATPREVHALATTFNEMAVKLENLIDAQQRFVADASHQLRTPLAALRLRLENLKPELPPGAEDDLDGAIAESSRLSRLVDGLLALASAERAGSAPQVVDLASVVAERHAAWSDLAEEHGVRLQVDVPGVLPALVTPGRLDQVLDNLLANALDASPPGGHITVTGGRAGDRVELHVTDQGPGLSAKDRERAFDRFWQGPTGGDGRRGGFGLGLAIVRQLLLADGGSIDLRPAAGGGLDVVVRVQAASGDRAGRSASGETRLLPQA